MVKVRVYEYQRQAVYWFKAWTRAHDDEIVGMNRRDLCVLLRSGDELHFVCKSGFDRWSRGRKYMIEQWEG